MRIHAEILTYKQGPFLSLTAADRLSQTGTGKLKVNKKEEQGRVSAEDHQPMAYLQIGEARLTAVRVTDVDKLELFLRLKL